MEVGRHDDPEPGTGIDVDVRECTALADEPQGREALEQVGGDRRSLSNEHENLGGGENRFSRDWMTSVYEALDEADAAEGPRALLTVASDKIWSNGLDLDWLTNNVDQAGEYVGQVQ